MVRPGSSSSESRSCWASAGRVVLWLRRRRRTPEGDERAALDAAGVTLVYCLLVVTYVAAITIAFAVGDHPRYRFLANPMYCLLVALLLTNVLDWWGRRHRGCAPTV